MGMDFKGLGNGGRNRMSDQAKFIDLDSISREFAFNVALW